ncbi:TIGR00266 family protein [Tissierella creatinophila]|uniref:TIGR00266 family protein n=1 Tax=Tissierella creatinophila DSM 6911 TaxID=1123403 RepID=A0A1U7M626_TISCR|nr:TIGR00266 family protein [Tissierella creatinophila]OLS02772.1 hypothetical protein TICRE_12570 [Tissierella creatinophila DSM 6911]
MKFSIEGDYPILRCKLNSGETIKTTAGAMSWMTEDIEVELTTGGGVMKGISRMFAGESLFLSYYTATRSDQEITFASSLPGTIMNIKMQGQALIAQKSAYLASEKTVKLESIFTKRFASGLLGGEGFILQKISGHGELFLEADGSLTEYQLNHGESLLVDQGHVFLFEESVSYEIKTIKGMKNVLFGGEGLFLVKLTGPGKIILQSMPISNLATKIIPFIPSQG